MRYERLTRLQAEQYLGGGLTAYYEENAGLDALLDRVTWIYETDNKVTIQFAPVGEIKEAREGTLGCCCGGGQDYWALEQDPDRPCVNGFPSMRWVLYRGLRETGTVHRGSLNADNIAHIMPVVFD